jgi:hypothetical protein
VLRGLFAGAALILIAFAFAPSAATGFGTANPSFTGPFDTAAPLTLEATEIVTQSFTAVGDNITAADIFFVTDGTTAGTVTFNVFITTEAGDQAPIIGFGVISIPAGTTATPENPWSSHAQLFGSFPDPVPVTPGVTYYLKIGASAQFAGYSWATSTSGTYAGGTLLAGVDAVTGADAGFRIYYDDPAVEDATGPDIAFFVAGWVTAPATLTWSVTEPDTPDTLVLASGCRNGHHHR